MRSSYIDNNYGNILRTLVLAHKPKIVVECGVLDGYSTRFIAHALKFLHVSRRFDKSEFYAYDLFEDYEYKHGNKAEVNKMIWEQGLSEYVHFMKSDAFDAAKRYRDEEVDFLHFDISNDGDILIRMLESWGNKISENGIIAFEGGSEERDEGWIKKYEKKSIREQIINNPFVYNNWSIQILDPFPSLTLMWRK